jgi:hypothetical protein
MSTSRITPMPATRRARIAALGVAAVAATVAVAVSSRAALGGDVTYALGGIETAGRGGVGVWDVFVARPLAYRLVLATLDGGRALLAGDASPAVADVVLRLETVLLTGAVVTVLFAGLYRFLPGRVAAAVAAATGLALAVPPTWHFLEPDWMAALAAVLAVGAACAPHRAWVGGMLGGLAALVAVAVKLATAPLALLALLAIAVLSRRRAWWTAGATVVFAAAWYALTRHFLPWEWRWLEDQATLVQASPIHHGFRWIDVRKLIDAGVGVAVLSPLVAVAPAAVAALVRGLPSGRPRWAGTAVAVSAAALAVGPAYGQGEFFMYHFAVVPVVAAAAWSAAYALRVPARVPLLAATVVFTVAGAVLHRMPAPWRVRHLDVVLAGYALAALAAAVVVWVAAGRAHGRTHEASWWAAGVVAVCVAQVPAALPGAPYAFTGYNHTVAGRPTATDGYVEVSERIGRETPVLYLTFGSVNHGMGNPTSCRYPSPQWLQRAALTPEVRTFPSYADNLRCLTGRREARYLVWQPEWFRLDRSAPDVRALIESRFDCSPAARVPSPPHLVVCPAR